MVKSMLWEHYNPVCGSNIYFSIGPFPDSNVMVGPPAFSGPPHGCPTDSRWPISYIVCQCWTACGPSVANATLWLLPECRWWSTSGFSAAHIHWGTTGLEWWYTAYFKQSTDRKGIRLLTGWGLSLGHYKDMIYSPDISSTSIDTQDNSMKRHQLSSGRMTVLLHQIDRVL